MTEPDLQDYDQKWREPDVRITTLKNKVDELKMRMDTTNASLNIKGTDLMTLEKTVKELQAEQEQYKNEVHLLQLFMMQKVTPDQFSTLRKMLYSVDQENHVVAIETINNLIKEL